MALGLFGWVVSSLGSVALQVGFVAQIALWIVYTIQPEDTGLRGCLRS